MNKSPLVSRPDPIEECLARLARGKPQAIANLLHDVEIHAAIDGTQVVCHVHSVKLDLNGRPLMRELVRHICDQVMDFAIPRGQIKDAFRDVQATNSTAKLMHLGTEARRLFTDLTKSGEGGELLLFVLAEQLLKLPQILCKMSLKTNSRMHVHGADGLHAGADEETGRLVLYWGESKIFNDATTAIRDCLNSLAPMLLDDASGGSAAERDLQLLQRYADVDDPALEAAFKGFLDVESEYFNSIEFRGLCLVGFDCLAYGVDSLNQDILLKKVRELMPQWKSQIQRRIAAEKLEAFKFHFINVPFPSADDFRMRIRQELGLGNIDASGRAETTNSILPVAKANEATKDNGPIVETPAPARHGRRRKAGN